jgi:hypothetical protein
MQLTRIHGGIQDGFPPGADERPPRSRSRDEGASRDTVPSLPLVATSASDVRARLKQRARSSGRQRTGSTLPPCGPARATICTLLPRSPPPPGQRLGRRLATLVARGFSTPPRPITPDAASFARSLRVGCALAALVARGLFHAGSSSDVKCRPRRKGGGEEGAKNPQSDERSEVANRVCGRGEGAGASAGCGSARAQGRREEAYLIYA